jgi:hypothetical protein
MLPLITAPVANEAMRIFQPLPQEANAIALAFEVGRAFR